MSAKEDRARRLALRQRMANDGLAEILESPNGRAYLWRLLSRCGIYEDAFRATDRDTARQTGKQAIGLEILLDMLTIDPGAYVRMQVENGEQSHVIATDDDDEL